MTGLKEELRMLALETKAFADTSALEKIEGLRRRVNVVDMLSRPFFKYLERQHLPHAAMRQFFCQYYTIVKVSYRMLAAGVLSTAPEDGETIRHLVRLLETEAGGQPTHLGHYLRWAGAFGVTIADLAQTTPNAASCRFEDVMMTSYFSRDSLPKLAAQASTEDCAAVLIEGLDRGFKKYPMSARTYAYLAIHRVLENDEDGHSRLAIDALAGRPNLLDRFDEVEAVYRQVYEAFTGVFDGIYEEWVAGVSRAALRRPAL